MLINPSRLLCLSSAPWRIHILSVCLKKHLGTFATDQLVKMVCPTWIICVQRLLGGGPRMAGAGGASLGSMRKPAWLVCDGFGPRYTWLLHFMLITTVLALLNLHTQSSWSHTHSQEYTFTQKSKKPQASSRWNTSFCFPPPTHPPSPASYL